MSEEARGELSTITHTNVCVCVCARAYACTRWDSSVFAFPLRPLCGWLWPQAGGRARSVTRGAYNDVRDELVYTQPSASMVAACAYAWRANQSVELRREQRVWSCPSRHTRRLVYFSSVPAATTRHTTHHYSLDKQSAS